MILEDAYDLDACSELGARRLAQQIVTYWKNRHYLGILAWAEKVEIPRLARRVDSGFAAPFVYTVRSNIGPDGYPPSI